MTDILYESLREGRFELVKRMAERLKGARYAKEQLERMAIMNHAIALKRLSRSDEMESVLSSMDWSASSPEFKLVLHALRDEEEEFYQLLPGAAAGFIERWQLEQWPAFAHQRGTDRFDEALERNFPNGASDNPDGAGDNE